MSLIAIIIHPVLLQRVRQYLSSHGISKGIYYDENASHGQSLAGHGDGHDIITEWLQQA